MTTKVIVFDFDGTLTKTEKYGNCWLYVWDYINRLDRDEYHYNKWRNKEYTHEQWNNAVFEEYRDAGVSRDMFTKVAAKSIKIDDLVETLSQIKEQGISIYILSGGIKNIIDEVLADCQPYITNIEAHCFTFGDDGIVNNLIMPNHNPNNKCEYTTRLINELGINPDELLFVGNGLNDETAYLSGCRTLCFNLDDAHYDNKTIWHDVVKSNSLKEILKYIK